MRIKNKRPIKHGDLVMSKNKDSIFLICYNLLVDLNNPSKTYNLSDTVERLTPDEFLKELNNRDEFILMEGIEVIL